MTETIEHRLGSALDDLEPSICDMADMADVSTVLVAHHRTQVALIADMDMTGKQAIIAMEHTGKLVDFCVYQLAGMAVSLRRQYYAADEVAS
jgi:hypothetical protein